MDRLIADRSIRHLRNTVATACLLVLTLAVLIGTGWVFGVVVQHTSGNERAGLDRSVLDWFVSHRRPWLTATMNVVTALGSSAVLVPMIVLVGSCWLWRRRTWRPFIVLGAAYLGAELLFQTVKVLVGRARPPAGLAAHHFAGLAFPSGHATLAAAVWGALATVIVGTSPLRRARGVTWTIGILLAVGVGVSRIYLGAHWLTDVLGGLALGFTWIIAVLVAVDLKTLCVNLG